MTTTRTELTTLAAEARNRKESVNPKWRPNMSASPTQWSDSFESAIHDCRGSLEISDPEGGRIDRIDARTVELLLSLLRTWPAMKGLPNYSVMPGLDFGIFEGRPFFRVHGSAYRTMDDAEVSRVFDRIRWTECPCCERRISRVRLLRIYEDRAGWYEPPECFDDRRLLAPDPWTMPGLRGVPAETQDHAGHDDLRSRLLLRGQDARDRRGGQMRELPP